LIHGVRGGESHCTNLPIWPCAIAGPSARKTESVDVAFRYTCAQAARELSLTPAGLSRRLRDKRIEPAESGRYSLPQLVDCMTEGDSPSERNAAARAELATNKARLVKPEIAEKEAALVPREEALSFLQNCMRVVYRTVAQQGLAEEQLQQIENEIYASFTAYLLDYGWQLEPTFELSANGEAVMRPSCGDCGRKPSCHFGNLAMAKGCCICSARLRAGLYGQAETKILQRDVDLD
jgi:hypothetical protein